MYSSGIPLKANAHPKDMTAEARMNLGKSVESLHRDILEFGHAETGNKLTSSIYSPHMIFSMSSPVYPSLVIHGRQAYSSLVSWVARYLKIVYTSENRRMELLPTRTLAADLLKEEGVLCIRWKLRLYKRPLFYFTDEHRFPRFWYYWNYWNCFNDLDFQKWDKKFKEQVKLKEGNQHEHTIEGLSYFAFDAHGRVSHHIIDNLEPPMKESWLKWKWLSERFVRKEVPKLQPAPVSQHDCRLK